MHENATRIYLGAKVLFQEAGDCLDGLVAQVCCVSSDHEKRSRYWVTADGVTYVVPIGRKVMLASNVAYSEGAYDLLCELNRRGVEIPADILERLPPVRPWRSLNYGLLPDGVTEADASDPPPDRPRRVGA